MRSLKAISIFIETENAAFDVDPYAEIARMLRDLADHVEGITDIPRALYDINGNRAGTVDTVRE